MPICWIKGYYVECNGCPVIIVNLYPTAEEATRHAVFARDWECTGDAIYCPECVAAGRVPPGPDGKPSAG